MPVFYQQVREDSWWHYDDATQIRMVTICGKGYTAKETTSRSRKEPFCPDCEQEMVKMILRYGVPEMAEDWRGEGSK